MIQGGKRRVVCHGASHCGAGGLYKRRGSASCAPGPRPTSRTQTPWRRSKKLSRPRGRDPPEACTRHTDRGVVPGRDAGWPEEQAHLSMGQEGLTPPRRSRSTHPVDLSVRGCLPRTRGWRRPSTAGLQQRGHATPPRRNRNQSYPRRARDRPPRSSRVAWRQGSQGPKQPLAHAAAAARTRTQRSGKYLAIHAAELALEPCLQILRRHRRPLLLRLEHAYRSTLEDHVHRAPRLGERRLLNVRIGISSAESNKHPLPLPPPQGGGSGVRLVVRSDSSALQGGEGRKTLGSDLSSRIRLTPRRAARPRPSAPGTPRQGSPGLPVSRRSEEHTSEL